MDWRLITDDDVSPSFGLAADEVLARGAGEPNASPALRLYTYRSHCALVGRFQTVENEIHVEYCRAQHIPINRRPTGGGAIIMGADQLGIALTIPARGGNTYSDARDLMTHFSNGLVRGLQTLGVDARFRRKNDIEVDGRKLAGLGIYRAPTGGLLFHASLLVDLDVALMLKVLNTPFEKISDKEISTVAARTSTVRKEMGNDISLDEIRQCIAQGYAAAFDVNLCPEDFTADERVAVTLLEQEKYQREDWVFQTTAVPDTVGTAKIKTPAGLLDVRVTLAGRMLKAVHIGGDFFASERAIADLEGCLRWHSSNPKSIAITLGKVYHQRQAELNRLKLDALVESIQKATRRAQLAEKKASSDPYGCFVTPGGAHV